MMGLNKRRARIVGACFLISNVVFMVGAVVFLEPVLSAPDYLTLVSANRAKVVLGALLEILNAFAYLGIAVYMFPVLEGRFESLALGYVGFRVVEFVMQILSDLAPLALLTVSAGAVGLGASIDPSVQTAGTALLAQRAWAFQMVSITLGSGALLFYSMLYQLKLIPRFISIWGFLGALIVLANTLFDMFGVSLPNLGFLMLLNELFLGVWLIVRGFNPIAVGSRPAPATAL
jgi:hypothetical protein